MRNTTLFILGSVFAIWFALTAWIWLWALCLVISYPAGIIALICFFNIREEKELPTKMIPVVVVIGFICSVGVLYYPLIKNYTF